MSPVSAIPVWEIMGGETQMAGSPSIDASRRDAAASGELLSEIAETRKTLEDIACREREKREEEERQHLECQNARKRFADEEAHRISEKVALGQEVLEWISELRKDTVFLEGFKLCMKVKNRFLGLRDKDHITIFERNLTRPAEASPEDSWLVGHREVLDTFRLDPSLNLIFRQYVPPAHFAEGIADAANPCRGERRIREAADFAQLSYDTVRGLHEALRSNSVRQTLAGRLKEYRGRLGEDLIHNAHRW
ncbi:hypothetical protein MUP79_02200 [Candidatus Bathyarchaeota archaeon]|nr:hypothetical protein [Candidatus Bathyarchaeota archaeon]